MAAQAIPMLTKAGLWLKGLMGAGKTKAALTAAASGVNPFLKDVAPKGSRMAAQQFANYVDQGSFMKNAMQMMPKTGAEWGMRVAPDALFGVMAGAMTPGDLGDKLIAGTTATAGGALGGIGLRGAVGGINPKLMNNPMLDITTEMIGGISGDIAAQGVADGIMRVKGGGMTPYERLAADQQKQLEQDILSRYLSGKGGYPGINDNTGLY